MSPPRHRFYVRAHPDNVTPVRAGAAPAQGLGKVASAEGACVDAVALMIGWWLVALMLTAAADLFTHPDDVLVRRLGSAHPPGRRLCESDLTAMIAIVVDAVPCDEQFAKMFQPASSPHRRLRCAWAGAVAHATPDDARVGS